MVDDTSTEPALTRIWRVIRAELALYPGRVSLIVRIVVACTASMMLMMIFRVPGAALGAYYPLLLSRDSPRSTRRSALRTALVCTLATAEVIVSAMIFGGSPFLHFLWVAGNLFAVFYMISSFTIYDAGLAVGLLITNAITTWDLPVSSEARVTLTLYTLLSILIGCGVSVIVEYLLAGTHSTDAVRDGIQQRLAAVGTLLNACAQRDRDVAPVRMQVAQLATKGVGHLREQLAHSSYERGYKVRLGTALALTGRLVELAAALAEQPLPVSPDDCARLSGISAVIGEINEWLAREEAPDWIDVPESAELNISLPAKIERAVNLISQSLTDDDSPVHHHLPEPGEEPHLPSFVADAFTNQRHVRFAIRGTLSALACYLLYMSVGWTGLGASIATCMLTALTTTGASRHKQLMRFAGMILGACVLGFSIQSIFLPQIDSLFTFSLVFAAVMALGAWVGTSGPRIAYAGAQIVLAYDLVNLNRFTIATSLVPARDVVLGIVLGIAAMWLIFDHLWASPSIHLTRSVFLRTFHEIANLALPDDLPTVAARAQYLIATRERIHAQLDRVRSLVDMAIFEGHPKPDEEVYLSGCVKVFQPELRAFLLVDSGLLQHSLAMPSDAPLLVSRVRGSCHAVLLEAGRMIETREVQPSSHGEDLHSLRFAVDRAMQEARAEGRERSVMEMRMCASLLALAHHLHSSALSVTAVEIASDDSMLPALA